MICGLCVWFLCVILWVGCCFFFVWLCWMYRNVGVGSCFCVLVVSSVIWLVCGVFWMLWVCVCFGRWFGFCRLCVVLCCCWVGWLVIGFLCVVGNVFLIWCWRVVLLCCWLLWMYVVCVVGWWFVDVYWNSGWYLRFWLFLVFLLCDKCVISFWLGLVLVLIGRVCFLLDEGC